MRSTPRTRRPVTSANRPVAGADATAYRPPAGDTPLKRTWREASTTGGVPTSCTSWTGVRSFDKGGVHLKATVVLWVTILTVVCWESAPGGTSIVKRPSALVALPPCTGRVVVVLSPSTTSSREQPEDRNARSASR